MTPEALKLLAIVLARDGGFSILKPMWRQRLAARRNRSSNRFCVRSSRLTAFTVGDAPSRVWPYAAARSFVLKTWASEMPVRKAWADALIEIGRTGTGVYQSPTDRIPEARDIIGGAMQQIVLGKGSPQEAAQAADAELAKLQ